MRCSIFLVLVLAACNSRMENINKKLVKLNANRDSLNNEYRMLLISNDSLKQLQANNRIKYGKPDSALEAELINNANKMKSVLNEANKVIKQIEESELQKY